jgi:uncharacterized protein YdhG (YjbR/CyaY superfamily)
MAEKKPAKKGTKKKPSNSSAGFSAGERAAMKEYAQELKAQRAGAEGETMVQEAIAKMKEPDRTMAKRLHAVIKASAPTLVPKTWYGMPAYAKGGKVVCFFRDAHKFKERYSMLGFNDSANLDEGSMWPVAFALEKLGDAEEKKISALVKKAVR